MHPIAWSIHAAPETVRAVALVLSVVLSAFIVVDTVKTSGREKLASGVVQGLAFFAVSFPAAWVLLTKERLPADVVLDIRSWGVATVTGMVACFLVQRRLGAREGLTSETIFSLWVWGGLAAIAGARALHVAVNWTDYAARPLAALAFWDGGLAYLGGALGAIVVGGLYARRRGLGLRSFDVLVLGMALTQGIGRVGCLLAGCCYGRETSLPWGVSFPEGSIAHYTLTVLGQLAPGATHTPPLHPTQLYEAAATFALGSLLFAWYRRRSPVPGLVTCAYFAGYSLVRFVIELFRSDPERQFLARIPEDVPLVLSTSQTIGLVLVAVAIVVARRLRGQGAVGAP
ncbi:prolipoprotein diacylglyceryl transferase [Myxococcota bacterium]|nr:prolipoprotein diacylglyceryl transferase [Myxococcota bacterium]